MLDALFGTDGIRGTTEFTNEHRSRKLTPELALRIGQAVRAAIIGRDPRISGMMLEAALTAGLLSQGLDVLQAGVIPTPAVAYLTRHLGASLGVVISASHNPVEDNGIKFFGPDGYKLDDALEDRIQSLVLDPARAFIPRDTRQLGRSRPAPELAEAYVDYLVRSWRGKRDLSRASPWCWNVLTAPRPSSRRRSSDGWGPGWTSSTATPTASTSTRVTNT